MGQKHEEPPGLGIDIWREGQSCQTNPLTCVVCCSLQIDGVRIELHWRTPSWCHRISQCGGTHTWCQKYCECGSNVRIKEKHNRWTEIFSYSTPDREEWIAHSSFQTGQPHTSVENSHEQTVIRLNKKRSAWKRESQKRKLSQHKKGE